MKSVKYAVLAALIGTFSLVGAVAQTTGIAPDDAGSSRAVNVSGSSNFISLEQQLSGKQDALRVKPLRITSTSGTSRLSGTAANPD